MSSVRKRRDISCPLFTLYPSMHIALTPTLPCVRQKGFTLRAAALQAPDIAAACLSQATYTFIKGSTQPRVLTG